MSEVIKDRVYKLKGDRTPLSFVLPSRDTKRFRLLYFDEKKNVNRVLRFASNFKSPFVDEQVGEAVMEDIIFEKGMLFAPKTNPALQAFLAVHPLNGKSFEEVDHERDAEEEIKILDMQAQAIIMSKSIEPEQAEAMYRVLFGKDPSEVQTKVIMRDIKLYARTNPQEFIEKAQDPALTVQSKVRMFFDLRLLSFRNHERDVHYNLRDNKTRLISVAEGRDPYREVQAYFETEEGMKSFEILEKYAEEM